MHLQRLMNIFIKSPASRMESTSEPSRIQISEACKVLLPNTYECEPRGTVLVKGKGKYMITFWTYADVN